jgi:hypothetical protein
MNNLTKINLKNVTKWVTKKDKDSKSIISEEKRAELRAKRKKAKNKKK